MTTDLSYQPTAGAFWGLERLWFRLIEPPASIQDPERWRQLRLLAGIALASASLASAIGVPFVFITQPNPIRSLMLYVVLGVAILCFAIYLMARAGRFVPASLLLVAVGLLAPWIASSSYHDAAYLMLLGSLFAFLLLPDFGVFITAGASLVGLFLLQALYPDITQEMLLPVGANLTILSLLFYVARRHLDAVAQEQQAILEKLNEGLTRQADEIDKLFRAAAVGDFSVRAQVFSDDVLGRAADGINAMLSQLSNLIQTAQSERASFMESFAGMVALTDMEGNLDYMNLAGAQMAGYTNPSEVVGKKRILDLLLPEDLQATMEVGIPAAIEKGAWTGENRLLKADGSFILVDQTIFVVRDEQGKPRNLGILMTDITVRKQTEAQLAAQNEALSNALEELRNLIANVDFAARQMTSASESIVDVVTLLTGQAFTSAQMAEQAASSAQEGDQAVNDAISAMGRIRESTQETTRRIKRLGEASQEIGEVVRLIDEIADRVTILALNASIQAAAAGEAGRGFAVVAEEVQRLAERATNATRQIENMVKSIQGDINEAMVGVEEATREVVDGSQLAQNAGERISDLKQAIGELSDLVQHVADTTSLQTTDALASLAALAADLQASVSALEIPAESSQISDNGDKATAHVGSA